MARYDVRTYEVVVGNIGTVYTGRSQKIANETFETYRKNSINGVGRGGYEDVILLHGGEPEKEHFAEVPEHVHECPDCEAHYKCSEEWCEDSESEYCAGCKRERYDEGNLSFFEP